MLRNLVRVSYVRHFLVSMRVTDFDFACRYLIGRRIVAEPAECVIARPVLFV
jgi:hypothetical protein